MKMWMRSTLFVAALFFTGCAAMGKPVAPYQPVDLKADLDKQTLDRYQAEMKQVNEAGGTCHMASLEGTNQWPLGLLAYWNRGSVQTMPGKDGQLYYMVSQTRGYGPLSFLYVAKEDATYDANGKLLNNMAMRSVGGGHVAMFHEMQTRLDDSTMMTHNSSHLLGHAINISDMDGMKEYSLFSAPNPVGISQ